MRKSIRLIFAGIFIIVIATSTFIIIRFNLTYRGSISEKLMMAGCMNKVLEKSSFFESKKDCECMLDNLLKKYDVNYLKKSMKDIIKKERELIIKCVESNMPSTPDSVDF